MRADVDKHDSLLAILGEDGGVAACDGFVDGLVDGKVSAIDSAEEIVVFLRRERDEVGVRLDDRGEHFAGIVEAGVIVDHEVLGQ